MVTSGFFLEAQLLRFFIFFLIQMPLFCAIAELGTKQKLPAYLNE
jgi:hypothetical protein